MSTRILIWHANPALIDDYQMGGGTRKPKLILDETLQGIQKALTQLFEVETGCKMPKQMKRMSKIIALIQQELEGLTVAYKDPKGRLAWKASAEVEREHNPEPEVICLTAPRPNTPLHASLCLQRHY